MRHFHKTYWALERRIVPGLRSSQYAYLTALREQLRYGTRWLDTGCGHQVLPDWMSAEEGELFGRGVLPFGIDLDLPALKKHKSIARRVYGDLRKLPFEEQSFDLVSANMVAEHLDDPVAVLREMRRVLVPGGRIVIHTVNTGFWAVPIARLLPDGVKRRIAGALEDRAAEDVFKTHYRLNSARAFTAVAQAADLEVSRISRVSGTAVLATLGVLAVPELLWISLLRWEKLSGLRSNIVAVLMRPHGGSLGV